MANRATTGFFAGLMSGGLNSYFGMKAMERADAREAREQEKFDADQKRQTAIDDATREAQGVLTDGVPEPVPASPPMQAVQVPQGSFDTAAAGGVPADEQPQYRPATNSERQRAYERLALAKGDVNAAAGFGDKAQADEIAKQDMADVQAVVANPRGKEAQDLLKLVNQNADGGQVTFDPETGMYTGAVGKTPVNLTPAQFGQLAMARNQLSRGDPAALATLADIDKNLAGVAAGTWKAQLELARFNNDATAKGVSTQIAQNKEARAAETHAANTAAAQQAQADEAAKGDNRLAELMRTNPSATEAQQSAARLGQIDPFKIGDDKAPAAVKLANAYVRSGLAGDFAEGLKMATQSKDYSAAKVRADIYGKALAANYGDATRAQQATEAAMEYLFAPPPSAATGLPPKEELVRGQTYEIPGRGPMKWTGTGFVSAK